uniref:Uncharacterized protein n=1 Tax=Meloidogyne enterolobii TaxID=390850 RepID=A0A6V7VKI6_MELEN|nr:unnamed protein product [Meloidogyne enterolobii]
MENLSTKTRSIGNYEQFSYCARLKLFGSKGIDIVKNGTLFERNNPKSISEYKKNYMQDMALVMIEGCVICGNSSNQTITLKFIQLHPKHIINFASEIDIKNLTDHVFEMRGLSINLTGNSTEETYDWEKTANEYFIPKKVAELKTTTELVPTIETINNTTEASNTTTTKKIVLPKNGVDFDGIYDEEKEDEKMKEEKEEDKEDEIKQGEENVVERIYLEETTHSNDEGKENEENKNDEMTTSKPEEVSTKTEKINEEKEKEEINEKLEEKHNEEREGENEIKEEEGKDDNESKDEVMNKGNEEENEDGEKENLKENKGEN